MSALFTIETDRARLTWREVKRTAAASIAGAAQADGLFALRVLRLGATARASTRQGTLEEAGVGATVNAGPRLFEQCEYGVALRALGARDVALTHRDPLLLSRFGDDEPGRFDGLVNFQSQIGVSTFCVVVDGVPEFEFDVEVFPTKLDYKSDYDEILADVQESLSGLALEYLRATWRGASAVSAPDPTQIEWLTLLRSVVEELERALRHIASRPVRGLRREETVRRAEQVHRVDSGLRALLRRQAQRGGGIEVLPGVRVPERVSERRAQPTLDTPEHRWIAAQVERIRRRLAELLAVEVERAARRPSERSKAIAKELRQLEARASRWSLLEPLQLTTDLPPQGFASLQLLTAPGYREAYRACTTLSLGLRLEGGPLQLSVKDLNLLYEYWCYLALLRIVAEETKAPIDPRTLLEVRDNGLSVLLKQGRESKMPFALPDGRRLTVRYNPAMNENALVPQRPDMLLTLEHPAWPAVHLVLDAKYRLDATSEYVARYKSPGPPEDALNAMHRYRDAILDELDGVTRRTVVQAAALFPLRPDSAAYEAAPLWRALERIGVGAIPLLPGQDQFLRAWLRRWLDHGGWDTADKAIDHAAIHRSTQWRRAAAEPVLIGALRREDPAAHLAWIREKLCYYTPLAKEQRRLFAAGAIAFFEPARVTGDHGAGAVRHAAKVLGARVVLRREIATPWEARDGDEAQVLYELGTIAPLPRPIKNKDRQGSGRRIGSRWWSSRLALERAQTVDELFLETEPEWRLYEELQARSMTFRLRAQPPKLHGEGDLQGRVQFVLDQDRAVSWAGAAGFVVRGALGAEVTVAGVQAVLAALER